MVSISRRKEFRFEDLSSLIPRVPSGLLTSTIYPLEDPSRKVFELSRLSNLPMNMEKFAQLDGKKERILSILATSCSTLRSSKSCHQEPSMSVGMSTRRGSGITQ